jgi:hypothetical protein
MSLKNVSMGWKFLGNIWEIYGTYLRNIVKWEWVNLYSVATCPAKPAVTRLLLTCFDRQFHHHLSSAEDCRVRVIWIIDPTNSLFEAGIRKQQLQGYYMILPFCKLDTRGFPTICGSFSGKKQMFSTSMFVYPRVIEGEVVAK